MWFCKITQNSRIFLALFPWLLFWLVEVEEEWPVWALQVRWHHEVPCMVLAAWRTLKPCSFSPTTDYCSRRSSVLLLLLPCCLKPTPWLWTDFLVFSAVLEVGGQHYSWLLATRQQLRDNLVWVIWISHWRMDRHHGQVLWVAPVVVWVCYRGRVPLRHRKTMEFQFSMNYKVIHELGMSQWGGLESTLC